MSDEQRKTDDGTKPAWTPRTGQLRHLRPKTKAPGRKPAQDKGPSADELEALFWDAGLDLLVDGRKLFLGAEFVELLTSDASPALEPQPDGAYRLTLGRQLFELGPYDEEADAHPVRWLGRAEAAVPLWPRDRAEPEPEAQDELTDEG